jgi:hypothetical protein
MYRAVTRVAAVATASYLVVDGLGLATDAKLAALAGLLLVLAVDVFDLLPSRDGVSG